MNALDAIMLIEDPDVDVTEDQLREAWQSLVDSGLVWELQGSYGRGAVAMIEAGYLQPAGLSSKGDAS